MALGGLYPWYEVKWKSELSKFNKYNCHLTQFTILSF